MKYVQAQKYLDALFTLFHVIVRHIDPDQNSTIWAVRTDLQDGSKRAHASSESLGHCCRNISLWYSDESEKSTGWSVRILTYVYIYIYINHLKALLTLFMSSSESSTLVEIQQVSREHRTNVAWLTPHHLRIPWILPPFYREDDHEDVLKYSEGMD